MSQPISTAAAAAPPQTDDLQPLLAALPETLRAALAARPLDDLLEIILDLGRPPQACFPGRCAAFAPAGVSQSDIDEVVAAVGEFNADNRAGIEGTLHRISAMRNRRGRIIGLTMRVGRTVTGTIAPIRHLVEAGTNTLLLGRPGVGKTTRLREIARVLSESGRRVVVVDTSNEIAGDGDIPHPAIGGARRMQVPHPEQQHAVMIEAVENHMPEVIVIDEIGTVAETQAARTIAERGVQLIGTAHGDSLESLVMNPTLSDLVGGIQTVTLGDEEARLRGTQKSIRERKSPPTFDAVVELVNRDELLVHGDAAAAVDRILQGAEPGGIRGVSAAAAPDAGGPEAPPGGAASGAVLRSYGPARGAGQALIFPYAISRDNVERVIRSERLNARTVSRPEHADMIVALRSRAGDNRLQRIVQATGLPLHLVKKTSTAQLRRLLLNVMNVMADGTW